MPTPDSNHNSIDKASYNTNTKPIFKCMPLQGRGTRPGTTMGTPSPVMEGRTMDRPVTSLGLPLMGLGLELGLGPWTALGLP